MDLDALTQTSGEWLRGTGPESDVVMSSRIRLARNLAAHPFLSRADSESKARVAAELREVLEDVNVDGILRYLDVGKLSKLDRAFLTERQLISRELAETRGARGVAFGREENVSVMINEEDHLRMQVLRSGLMLDEAWDQANRLDDQIEEQVTYAFSERQGYLTACPTNVGTGIRVSVMMHLPALVLTKEVQKVYQAMQKISLAVRGLHGEGSQASGDFYQISNQQTLGQSEEGLLAKLSEVVENVIAYERKVRKALRNENRQSLHDQISRALGTLRSAQSISSEETLKLLSSVRLGLHLDLLDDLSIPVLNELFVHTQPAHLQKLRGEELNQSERNATRAAYIRKRLEEAEN